MIAHVLVDTIFAQPFVALINSRFPDPQQTFLLMTDKSSSQRWFDEYPNVTEISTSRRHAGAHLELLKQLRKATRGADRIFFHSLYSSVSQEFLLAHPAIRKKSIWVVWGADLYPHLTKTTRGGLRPFLERTVLRKVARSSPFSMTLTPGDGAILEEFAGRKLRILSALYCNPVQPAEPLFRQSGVYSTDRPLRILIGNSATKTNRHMDLISMLARFKDQEIRVIAPLGYGDSEYAQAVCDAGFRELGNRFVPLRTLASPHEYERMLASVDVAVFNNDRQQGLGTIFALGYLGKKIYTPRSNSSWEYVNSFFPVYATESLADVSFGQFGALSEAKATEISRGAAKLFDQDFIAEHWRRAFDWSRPE